MLSLLKLEASQLNEIIINVTPSRDAGTFIGNFFHREQSLGEIRGLKRLENLIMQRKIELENKINPPKDFLPDAL